MDRKTEAQRKKMTCPKPPGAEQGPVPPPSPNTCQTTQLSLQFNHFGFSFFFFLLISPVKLPTATSGSEKTTKGTHENKVKVQMPEEKKKTKNKQTPGQESNFLRHCLEFYWQQGSAFHMLGPGLTARCLFASGTPTSCPDSPKKPQWGPDPSPASPTTNPGRTGTAPTEESSPVKHSHLVSV